MKIVYKEDLTNGMSNRTKYLLIGFVFLWSLILTGLGIYQTITTKTPQEYTFVGFYEFQYSYTRHETDRRKTSSGMTKTDHDYFVTYSGYVDNTNLEYVVKNADTSSIADDFIKTNPTVDVQVFNDSEDYLVISENRSLEGYLENQKSTGMIFAIVGSVIFSINLVVAFFVLKKNYFSDSERKQ